jgi:hypothetical protein
MKVCIQDDDGAIIWSRSTEPPCSFTAQGYLRDGTQQKIIATLVEALAQARGQLGGFSLKVVDAVADIRASAPEINRRIPVAVAGNRDAGR